MKTKTINDSSHKVRFNQVQQTLRFTTGNKLCEAGEFLSLPRWKWLWPKLPFDLLALL